MSRSRSVKNARSSNDMRSEGDFRSTKDQETNSSAIAMINLMIKANKQSVLFLSSTSQRVHLKTLSYLLARMAEQQQRMQNTLQNIRLNQQSLYRKSLNANNHINNRKLANDVMQWYAKNMDRQVNSKIQVFIEELENNERKLLLFYRYVIQEFKSNNLVNALASNIASIQMTFDKLRQTRFKTRSASHLRKDNFLTR